MSFNPNCHACQGGGIDLAFGGKCGECWIDADRTALLAQRYAGVNTSTTEFGKGQGEGKGQSRKAAPAPAAEIDGQAEAALVDWLREQTWSDFAQSLASFYGKKGYLSPKQLASAQSMKAKCDARQAEKATAKPAPKPVQDTDKVQGPGMFAQGDMVYKVQASKSTGNLYALVLLNGSFEYAQGMIRKLREQDRMSLEDAKAYGRATGTCCCCGKTLTNPDSIAAGIGPICAQGF